MSMISSRQLARMRADVLRMLPDTGTILGATYVSDGEGGGSVSYSPVTGGTVPYRLDPMNSRQSVEEVAGREALISEFILTTPYDTPLAADRRFATASFVYEIRALMDDHSWRVSRRARVARID